MYSHNLNKNLLASHQLRLKKLANYDEWAGVTGSAEYASNYVLHKYQRPPRRQHTYLEKLPFLGVSETTEKFNSYPFEQAARAFKFNYSINPTLSVQRATHPRRLARLDPVPPAKSEYAEMFVEPKPENLTARFEWMRK
jgi:hypothetical protein